MRQGACDVRTKTSAKALSNSTLRWVRVNASYACCHAVQRHANRCAFIRTRISGHLSSHYYATPPTCTTPRDVTGRRRRRTSNAAHHDCQGKTATTSRTSRACSAAAAAAAAAVRSVSCTICCRRGGGNFWHLFADVHHLLRGSFCRAHRVTERNMAGLFCCRGRVGVGHQRPSM